MESFLYILLAILGLSFLIFIHELGHYFMARRVGMRVETFSIGFGKPIVSWVRDGVKWQIGWLLFGGFVKIAGTEVEKNQDPYSIPDGFFGKSPWDRIKVAFMGPLVNLVFALLVFGLIWAADGREKNFAEFTSKIGWVDPKSELYARGVRPGDEITAYNDHSYQGAKDHIYLPMTSVGPDIRVQGNKVDYETGEKKPFEYSVRKYPHPSSLDKGIVTAGIMQTGSFIIYDRLPNGQENPLPEGSPLEGSGIQYGDRIVWVDGELIFSSAQLDHILNESRALLTIQRGNDILLKRVPRVNLQELRLDSGMREELSDWQFAAQLNGTKFQNLVMIPYNLNNEGVVEARAKFVDRENEEEAFTKRYSELETPLEVGDKIIAVDGTPLTHSSQLLALLQQDRVNIIVERDNEIYQQMLWTEADANYNQQLDLADVQKIAHSIGTDHPLETSGNVMLLKPVTPKMRKDFILSPEKQSLYAKELQDQKKMIESIEDPEKRTQTLQLLAAREKQLKLGLPNVQDRKVIYNPIPTQQFMSVFNEIWRTLTALFTGSLNPKFISGPIGIVQVVHDNSMVGIKEALFWIGAISLNLGVLNLLPIPMLDGGTILISFLEVITGKKIPPKTLEKLILPFAVLLIGFFIYLTYNDLLRIFGNFMH